jgi:hypothetical protein
MILKLFSPKNLAKILAFFAQTTAVFCKNCDHNIGFRRKLAKNAENCDHNIDPRLGEFSIIGPLISLGSYFENDRSSTSFAIFFTRRKDLH